MRDKNESQIENLELLVSQQIELQQKQSQGISEIVGQLKIIKEKVDGFDDRLATIKVESPAIDLKPVKAEITRGIFNISHAIGQNPRSIVRTVQILLFPPHDAKLFYKIVFGRWLMWLCVLIAIMYLYNFAVQRSNDQTMLKMREIENNQMARAWQNLYSRLGKKQRKQLDSILNSEIVLP